MTFQWVPVVCDKMAPLAYLFLVSGILIEVSRGDYCLMMEQDMLSSHDDSTGLCALVADGSASQCSPHDLTTIIPMGTQYKETSFWIERGNLCTSLSCPALVRNTSDPVAHTSIQCLTCSDPHAYMCNFYGACNSGTNLPLLSTDNHTGSCQNDWERHNGKEYMISPVRRRLEESQSWCTMMNGSTSLHRDALKYVEQMTLPHPKMAYYWIAVPHIGQLLTTNKNEGKTFTNTFNIIERGADAEKLYGCICIRKNWDATSTTSTTTTKTTPTTTQTTTKTTVTTTTAKPPQIHATGVKSGKYKNVQTMNGYMGSLEEAFTVRRSLECAMACDQKTTCKSYFFDPQSSTCRLNDQTYRPGMSSSLSAKNKAKYFERYQ